MDYVERFTIKAQTEGDTTAIVLTSKGKERVLYTPGNLDPKTLEGLGRALAHSKNIERILTVYIAKCTSVGGNSGVSVFFQEEGKQMEYRHFVSIQGKFEALKKDISQKDFSSVRECTESFWRGINNFIPFPKITP